MRQLFQSLDTGDTRILDVPIPSPGPGEVLIATRRSVVSAGTEQMLVDFGKSGLIGKARQQPERVREVIDKATTDGLAATVSAVRAKLAQPLPLGYSNAGVVVEAGPDVDRVAPGDRVVSNGPHAEFVCVPANLCAPIPDGPHPVSDEAAAFTVLAAIGLQGLRLAEPTLGERFVVTGLGLIGLLTVQFLQSHGCPVLGIDPDPERRDLARKFGVEAVDPSGDEDPELVTHRFSRGRGVDGVLLTAATSSNRPVQQAARMCRKRGRIVLVGVTGLELSRRDFYEKELTFRVSCSYGPGRYDPNYEEEGNDYPIGFVRWTETRNFEAVLDLLASGRLDPEPLVSERVDIKDALEAYEGREALCRVLQYPQGADADTVETHSPERAVDLRPTRGAATKSRTATIGLIGAGSYAVETLIPAFAETHADLRTVASRQGASAGVAADRFGFERATTDVEEVLSDKAVAAVAIATRHDTHADLTARALKAGKDVYVEKPLAISQEGIDQVRAAYESRVRAGHQPVFMVGFNRRFAPHVVRMREFLAGIDEPKSVIMTVNAEPLPEDHWVRNPIIGGGRIISEVCHFVDLLRHLADSKISDIQVSITGSSGEKGVTVVLTFCGGSTGTIHYMCNGHARFPKERLEVFSGGRVHVLDNFRRLKTYGGMFRMKPVNIGKQDKGHVETIREFIRAITSRQLPVPAEEIFEVSGAALSVAKQARR